MRKLTFESLYSVSGDHWIWHGCMNRGRPYFRDTSAVRHACEQEGLPLDGFRYYRRCEEERCINPRHHEPVIDNVDESARRRCRWCGQVKLPSGFEGRRNVCRDCRINIRQLKSHDNEVVKACNRRRRYECLQHYGGRCACCGETNEVFLVMDHVRDDGASHRKQTGTKNIYLWLKKRDFPEGFQVLCHNCNYAKSRGGCPHGTPAGQPWSTRCASTL